MWQYGLHCTHCLVFCFGQRRFSTGRPFSRMIIFFPAFFLSFRLCSTRRSRSQAGLYVYTHCMVSIHAEPTFERLRDILGGDRPSQTALLTLPPYPIQTSSLETQQTKGGIPRTPPHGLTTVLQCLPPILYMIYRISVLSCSKAPWGLSV